LIGSKEGLPKFDGEKNSRGFLPFEVVPSKVTVLVVDDEEMMRELVTERLKLEGYTVEAAENGEQALQKIKSNGYDLLLTDLNMPVLNGLELLKKLADNRDLATVVMSGQGDLETAVYAMKLGASDYIFKPINFRILLHTLESAMKKKMMEKALIDYQDNLEKKVFEQTMIINDFYLRSIQSLVKALEAKDSYTRGHSERVTFYSLELAKGLGKSVDMEKLRSAGILHDLGKIGIPETILNKPGKLENEEFLIVKKHPSMGVRILEPIESLKGVFPVIMHHPERYDGKGYPAGLQGEKIPIEARILAIADTYDAMTSNRAYRDALSPQKAVEEIDKFAGVQFDPDLASQFMAIQPHIELPDHISLPSGSMEAESRGK
jgi:putative two-component system response regulator